MKIRKQPGKGSPVVCALGFKIVYFFYSPYFISRVVSEMQIFRSAWRLILWYSEASLFQPFFRNTSITLSYPYQAIFSKRTSISSLAVCFSSVLGRKPAFSSIQLEQPSESLPQVFCKALVFKTSLVRYTKTSWCFLQRAHTFLQSSWQTETHKVTETDQGTSKSQACFKSLGVN